MSLYTHTMMVGCGYNLVDRRGGLARARDRSAVVRYLTTRVPCPMRGEESARRRLCRWYAHMILLWGWGMHLQQESDMSEIPFPSTLEEAGEWALGSEQQRFAALASIGRAFASAHEDAAGDLADREERFVAIWAALAPLQRESVSNGKTGGEAKLAGLAPKVSGQARKDAVNAARKWARPWLCNSEQRGTMLGSVQPPTRVYGTKAADGSKVASWVRYCGGQHKSPVKKSVPFALWSDEDRAHAAAALEHLVALASARADGRLTLADAAEILKTARAALDAPRGAVQK